MSSTKGRTRDKPNGRKTGTGGLRAPSRAVGKRDAAKRPGKTATKGSANAAKREASRQGSPFEGGRLVMPALRSEMGSWIYYTASMQLRDVAARVRLASDIYKSRSLSELIQRAVTNRSTEIATYLRKQKSDRFFNALVLGVHGGNTLWHDIDVGANPYLSDEELEQIDGQLGALILSGAEQIFAVDGQHRVVGIQEAVGDDEDLATEHLTVIFVPYDIWDPPGMRRTRRLFTTLNRYAKPVSKRDAIALDEDDTVAITTRRLIETYPLFQNEKVSVSHTKALPVSDRKAFTTVVALYDALDAYLQGGMSRREWREFKRFRPEDETVIERYYAQAVALWDAVCVAFPSVAEIATASSPLEAAAPHRSRRGGHILYRPIGLRALIRSVVAFRDIGVELVSALERLASVPTDLSHSPWSGVLWDPTTQRMVYAKENQDVAFALWFHMAGGPLDAIGYSADKLIAEWAGVTGHAPDEIQLPARVRPLVTQNRPPVQT